MRPKSSALEIAAVVVVALLIVGLSVAGGVWWASGRTAAAPPVPTMTEAEVLAAISVGLDDPPAALPAERWSEHLSGTWLDESGTAWTFDLDRGTITFTTAGGMRADDSPIRISVASEDGRTVAVRFTGRPGGDSVDEFRFLDENTLAWGELTLRRR
jgi:hypothetical protein